MVWGNDLGRQEWELHPDKSLINEILSPEEEEEEEEGFAEGTLFTGESQGRVRYFHTCKFLLMQWTILKD